MSTRQFVVTVTITNDHYEYLFDRFAKHVAYRFAGTAYKITDVETVNALNPQVAEGRAVDV